MKTLTIVLLLALLLFVSWLWYSGKNSSNRLESEVTQLNDSINHMSDALKSLDEQREDYKNQADSMNTVMLKYETSEVEPVRKHTKEEEDVNAFILKLQSDWEKAFIEKDPQKVLAHFMPEYTTNRVIIDTERIPNVKRHNETNFEEHLKAILDVKGALVDFGPVDFFYTYAIGKIFTTSFKTSVIVRYNYKVVNQSKIICFVSGENYNGEWKVGNYNWIRYETLNTMK